MQATHTGSQRSLYKHASSLFHSSSKTAAADGFGSSAMSKASISRCPPPPPPLAFAEFCASSIIVMISAAGQYEARGKGLGFGGKCTGDLGVSAAGTCDANVSCSLLLISVLCESLPFLVSLPSLPQPCPPALVVGQLSSAASLYPSPLCSALVSTVSACCCPLLHLTPQRQR